MTVNPVITTDPSIKFDQSRRHLVKALAAAPFGLLANLAFGQNYYSYRDMEDYIADVNWQKYMDGDESWPRHTSQAAEMALQELAAPIMATSTRKDLKWRIGLLATAPNDINACTVGGGVIFIHDSLISYCSTEAELASVIAHEVGHVEHRHAIQRIVAGEIMDKKNMGTGWSQKEVEESLRGRYRVAAPKLIYKSYERLWEHQADAFIINAFKRLSYSVQDSYGFFETLMQLEGVQKSDTCLFNTHPLTKERISRLKGLSRAYAKRPSRPSSEAFKFLKSELV